VTDEQLINTISQLDAAVTDILETERKNEETYQNKAALARHARQLETSIQITEAKAINTICGTGKDAYGVINYPNGTSVRVSVTNDTQRDAFRRYFSATERKELASVEADIKAIEVSQFKTREDLAADYGTECKYDGKARRWKVKTPQYTEEEFKKWQVTKMKH